MGDFAITVNNRRYTVACGADAEPRLERAAGHLDAMVQPLAERYGRVGDDRLLLLAALQIVDDLMTTREKLDEINALIAKSEALSRLAADDDVDESPESLDDDDDDGDDGVLLDADDSAPSSPIELSETAMVDEQAGAADRHDESGIDIDYGNDDVDPSDDTADVPEVLAS